MIYNGYYWILMDYIWDYMGLYGKLWEYMGIIMDCCTLLYNIRKSYT